MARGGAATVGCLVRLVCELPHVALRSGRVRVRNQAAQVVLLVLVGPALREGVGREGRAVVALLVERHRVGRADDHEPPLNASHRQLCIARLDLLDEGEEGTHVRQCGSVVVAVREHDRDGGAHRERGVLDVHDRNRQQAALPLTIPPPIDAKLCAQRHTVGTEEQAEGRAVSRVVQHAHTLSVAGRAGGLAHTFK